MSAALREKEESTKQGAAQNSSAGRIGREIAMALNVGNSGISFYTHTHGNPNQRIPPRSLGRH